MEPYLPPYAFNAWKEETSPVVFTYVNVPEILFS
jgi:hypothetical protein